jgi:hypothetical protein
LTGPQRLLWIDLLALAGRSRFPGEIYAGVSGDGKKVGYPIEYLAGVLQMDKIALHNALYILCSNAHIALYETAQDTYVIGIVNWEKYQSEYLRQKTYREVTDEVTTETTSRLLVEEEGEGDADVEGEKPTAHWCTFWNLYPRKVGKGRAMQYWSKLKPQEEEKALLGLKMWKQTEQWNRDDGKYIPYASTFLVQRRWEDEPWTGAYDEPANSKNGSIPPDTR